MPDDATVHQSSLMFRATTSSAISIRIFFSSSMHAPHRAGAACQGDRPADSAGGGLIRCIAALSISLRAHALSQRSLL
eukprot:2978111-Pleurochrysis_carterae.AAC.2